MTFPRKGGRGLKGRFGSDVPPRPSKPSPSLRQYPFTLPCLQCDYSNRGTRKKTIKSQGFLKTKDSRFFANGTIEFKVQLCNRWKLLNRLNLPDVSGKGTQIYECFRSRFAKKNLRIFCFQKKVVIGWSSKCPGSSSRTVRQDSFCCGVKYIVYMRLPVQEHILSFFNLEYKKASLPRITKVYNPFKASGLERYPVQDVRLSNCIPCLKLKTLKTIPVWRHISNEVENNEIVAKKTGFKYTDFVYSR